ncbi:MAG TPA: alanine/glycine:cation symporter family protein [Thermoguttaceae bacterium]|nr:alanine/glycine:cation symporter family protein [Thermoguttaceae bacterium]
MPRRLRIPALLILPLLLGFLVMLAVRGLAQDAPAQDAAPAESSAAEPPAALPSEAQADPQTPGDADSANDPPEPETWMTRVDQFFGEYLVKRLGAVLFFDFWTEHWLGTSVPLVVVWLFGGALFFTLRMGFINVRGFWHAIRVTRGDYDDPDDAGEVSHFQALASALSATVGLGNIAGVAIAVATGGPGAVFWLILGGVLGMSTKFSECSLGQMYRKVDRDGTVSGGPMHYLRDGLTELGLPRTGIVLATLFAIVCMGGSFGGGCVFQVSQSLEAVRAELLEYDVTLLADYPWIYGVVLIVLVGVVIIGGIRRIAATAEKIVPLMCGVYVLASLYILAVNHSMIVPAIGLIFKGAFSPEAIYGGFLGVMVIGIRRAAFSNEAGLGSASIAHAAAKTDEPISEGIVALLEPFIDTVVVCTMTGLVIVVTGVYNNSQFADYIANNKGAPLTAEAFRTAVPWFPWILAAAVCLFAYSTLISWSYYGERCWSHLFGRRTSLIYKFIFLGFVLIGSIVTATNLLNFSDLMILSMAFPNILGVVLLSGKIRRALDDYWRRLKAGELEPTPSAPPEASA